MWCVHSWYPSVSVISESFWIYACHLVPPDPGAVFPGTEAGWTSSTDRVAQALALARNCAAGSMATKTKL